jgi:Tfp pilus assembly protein PilP
MRRLVLVLCLLSPACVAREDRDLISTMSAVGAGNLREWDSLTPEQQREAHENLVAASAVLDHNVNDRDEPKQPDREAVERMLERLREGR